MKYVYDKQHDLLSLPQAEETCWLLANGLGGYSRDRPPKQKRTGGAIHLQAAFRLRRSGRIKRRPPRAQG